MAPTVEPSLSDIANQWLLEPGETPLPNDIVGVVQPKVGLGKFVSGTSGILKSAAGGAGKLAKAAGGGIAKNILTTQGLQAVVAGVQAGGILKRGREAEEIAAERAAIDRANAIAVRKASVERAKILAERGLRLREKQKAQFISGGIKTNVGVPLLVEAQTRADIAQDIGFDLEFGRVQAGQYLSSAELEEKYGRKKRRRSRWKAIGVAAERGLSFIGT
jgi:hypothetical protein